MSPATNRVSRYVVDASYRIHSRLGPGLLESVYESCLFYELTNKGLQVRRQTLVAIKYDDIEINAGLRLDLLVNDCLIVELKSVESILPIHHAQVLTYLKLTGHRLGLLIDFNVPLIKTGIKRIAL
ncbi:MAG: GxxExxY protein [Candidatus Latescibacteria bacterium]|nr:GxxExxY protein [Candidatus Latescibacterota bacterium]